MSELRDIQHSLPMQLLRAREAAMTRFRPMLREHGLTEQQWRVLRVLAAHEPVDASELARLTHLLAPSLSRILQFLAEGSLIRREPDRADQRRSLISLTAAGHAKFRTVGPDSETLYRAIEESFGKAKLDALYALLSDLNHALEEG